MNKINLDSLQVLESIERCGSFALAAKELHRVPSALTYAVNCLESQLNITIFDRSGHRAKLTPIGQMLLTDGRKLLISAAQLEKRIQMHRIGFEDQLLIAYDQLIPFKNLLFLFNDFYNQCPGVELKISAEVLGGCWDSLLSNRATIAIGVSGDAPSRDDLTVMPFGTIEFVFVLSKNHPLASKKGLLTNYDITPYRIIAVADSTRISSTRTTGILPEQSILTVSSFHEKIDAILAGLGVGYLPIRHAKKYIESGELIVKDIPHLKKTGVLSVAWRPSLIGKAGQWFIERLTDKEIAKKIL